MHRREATGAAATASMLRELADEIEDGVVWLTDSPLAVSDAGTSAAVNGAETTDGRLSLTVRLEAREDWRQGERGQASELERELSHPGD